MEPKNGSNVLLAQQFDSFEELADIAVSWNADFRQLDSERFKSEVFQAQIGSILLSNVRFGCHVDQRGATPAGMRTFAIPDVDCPEIRWFGHTIGPDVLLTFPKHGEIEAFSRPGFSVFTFSIPETLLSEFFERNGAPELEEVLGSGEVITPAPPSLLNGLRYQLQRVTEIFRNEVESDFNDIPYDDIQNQILFLLLVILSGIRPASRMSVPGKRSAFNRLFDHIESHAGLPLQIADLCAVAQVSERTLQYRFKKELGMSPKSYLVGQRLYGVHRELWAAEPSKIRISKVANNWGFWHMGQFAADYRDLFGELPSTTLKRTT